MNNAKVNTVKVSEAENLAIVQQMKSELETMKQREEELDKRHAEMQALMNQQKLVGSLGYSKIPGMGCGMLELR